MDAFLASKRTERVYILSRGELEGVAKMHHFAALVNIPIFILTRRHSMSLPATHRQPSRTLLNCTDYKLRNIPSPIAGNEIHTDAWACNATLPRVATLKAKVLTNHRSGR